jgi:tetratricopeptide (TPR) repeat protein
MGVTEELEKAQGLLASADIQGLLRHLRAHGEALPLGEVARLVAGAARLAEFDDLAQAAAAVAESGDGSGAQDARALYGFGYACSERGAGHLAVRPLARALELAPDVAPVLSELVAALEHDGQHARAVAVLEEHESVLQWLHRFQYVYNALMAGSLDKAAEGFGRLPEPQDAAWRPAREKARRMLARAGIARTVTSLDCQDLRGWHYVLTGSVLGSLSPYGFDAGMTGRWAYVSDSADSCAAALQMSPASSDSQAPARVCAGQRGPRESRLFPGGQILLDHDQAVR